VNPGILFMAIFFHQPSENVIGLEVKIITFYVIIITFCQLLF